MANTYCPPERPRAHSRRRCVTGTLRKSLLGPVQPSNNSKNMQNIPAAHKFQLQQFKIWPKDFLLLQVPSHRVRLPAQVPRPHLASTPAPTRPKCRCRRPRQNQSRPVTSWQSLTSVCPMTSGRPTSSAIWRDLRQRMVKYPTSPPLVRPGTSKKG